jgi:hypothetical protein
MFLWAVKLFHPFNRVFPHVSGIDFRRKITSQRESPRKGVNMDGKTKFVLQPETNPRIPLETA